MSKTYLMNKLSGQNGQYAIFQSDGSIVAGDISAGAKPQIHIHAAEALSSVTVNGTSISGSGTDWEYNCAAYGSYTVVATYGLGTYTETVKVNTLKRYTVDAEFGPMPEKGTLNECSWANIREISDYGTAASYWNVGDCKEITINGTLSDGLTLDNAKLWVFIIGFDHDIDTELNGGHTITFNGFKTSVNDSDTYALCDSGYMNYKTSGTWFNMNNSDTNTGSWNSSRMRSTVIPQIISRLPSDLQSVLKTVKKKSIKTYNATTLEETSDKLFLLAESEIYGGASYAKTSEGTQYPWFTSKGITTSSWINNVRKNYNGSAGSACVWWERSPTFVDSDYFCFVNVNGSADYWYASVSYGVSPAFCV